MRPLNLNDNEQLRLAHAREDELRESWRTANYRAGATSDKLREARAHLLSSGRAAAGRVLIRFGRRVLPAGTEPCM